MIGFQRVSVVWFPYTPAALSCVEELVHKGTGRCLAFAHERNGRLHWFDITAAWQDPVELYGVTGFVPVANATPMFV